MKEEYRETSESVIRETKSTELALAKANEFQSVADRLFLEDDMFSKYKVAFSYRLAADLVMIASTMEIEANRPSLYSRAGSLYHFAGHAFRRVEEYRWSGETYTKSGECFEKEMHSKGESRKAFIDAAENSIRAYRRAKGVFSEVGDYGLSGRAYLKEQKVMQELLFKTDLPKGILFWLWGIFSGYGESALRWFMGYLLGLGVFGLFNTLAGMGLLQGFYVSFERSLLIAGQANDGLLVVQFAYSYFILGLGLTLIVRRMTAR